MKALSNLDTTVEARSAAIQAEHGFWPCKRGCDACCRSLASLPMVTRPEWERIRNAVAALDDEVRSDVHARIMSATAAYPVVCPMLNASRGECRIYAARPIACRTYGFYAERDAALHCDDVARAVRDNDAQVVWGNGESINRDLDALGELRSRRDWLLST